MKNGALCILIAIGLIVTTNACGSCPTQSNPVCGFNGTCVYVFKSACELIRYNCIKRTFFRQIDAYQCESARKSNGRYMYCINTNGRLW